MLITMLRAHVEERHWGTLVEAFDREAAHLPSQIEASFLARERGTDLWRVVTVWGSRQALEDYRSDTETPGGVLMFRSVGVEPELTIHEVARSAARG